MLFVFFGVAFCLGFLVGFFAKFLVGSVGGWFCLSGLRYLFVRVYSGFGVLSRDLFAFFLFFGAVHIVFLLFVGLMRTFTWMFFSGGRCLAWKMPFSGDFFFALTKRPLRDDFFLRF